MTAEHARPTPHEAEPIALEDPLQKQRNLANRIIKNLDALDVDLTIKVLGCFHQGIIGNDIKGAISQSDIVTFELPSEIPAQARKGISGKALSENPFWADVLDFATSQNKRIAGVTTNRAVVLGLRTLNYREREGDEPFKGGPDLVISARTEDKNLKEILDGAEISPHAPGQPFLATVKRKIDVGIEPYMNLEELPLHTSIEGENGRIYLHYLKSLSQEEATILVATGDWSSPMEFAHTKFGVLMRGYEHLFPDVYNVADFGTQHLMRLRGDRTQVGKMLEEVDKELKRQKKSGVHKPVTLAHIGGGAHDRNILAILNNLFSEGGRVTCLEQFDERKLPTPTDLLTFFSTVVPVADGLRTTDIFEDQVLINIPRALSVLRSGIEGKSGELYAVGKRKEVVDAYDDIVISHGFPRDSHLEAAEYLLSFLPQELVMKSRIFMGRDFLQHLAEFVISSVPGKDMDVIRALAIVRQSSENFPPQLEKNEFRIPRSRQ